jgi:hypothetical protein
MKFSRVHAVCAQLRDEPCKLCPRREPSPYGPTIRGCRLHAEEVINIAKHGYPWTPPYNKRQKEWRKRWNKMHAVKSGPSK